MPPKEASSSEFNARDTELVLACFKCLSSKPNVNYEKFAAAAGYANAPSAARAMNKLWSKFGAEDATEASPQKRKAPTEDDVEGESPKKKKAGAKKGKKGAKAVSEIAANEEADGEEDAVVKEEE